MGWVGMKWGTVDKQEMTRLGQTGIGQGFNMLQLPTQLSRQQVTQADRVLPDGQ